MDNTHYKKELGNFFKMARERINPDDVGIVSNGRRRTPGLRREEVAQLAAVSLSWYVNIEQGNDVQPSNEIIQSIEDALQLTRDERRYVDSLLNAESREQIRQSLREDATGLNTLIDTLDPNPSYTTDDNFDVYYWNHGATDVLDFPEWTSETPPFNLLKWFLTSKRAKELNADWKAIALSMIGRFRLTVASHIQDAKTQSIVADLRKTSPLFDENWDNYMIEDMNSDIIEFHHPTNGLMKFQYISLELTQSPTIKVMTFVAL